jgi:hypothetical protein
MVPAAWLVSINDDGAVAFRTVDAFRCAHDREETVGRIQRSFASTNHSLGNLSELKSMMHTALVADGLYPDEATAMLSTWQDAYFASPGLRLFYVVPTEWTDNRMPLTIDQPAEIERVMVGRIELVSDRQIELLQKLESQPNEATAWFNDIPTSEAKARFWKGENNLDELASLGVTVPDSYLNYVDMGRFRNALLRHDAMQTGNANVLSFLRNNGLMTQELLQKYPLKDARKELNDEVVQN